MSLVRFGVFVALFYWLMFELDSGLSRKYGDSSSSVDRRIAEKLFNSSCTDPVVDASSRIFFYSGNSSTFVPTFCDETGLPVVID